MQVKISGRLVEVSEVGTYQGQPYASLKLRTETARGQEILKFKVDVKIVNQEAVAEMLDEDVVLLCQLEKQGDLGALRVVDVKVAA